MAERKKMKPVNSNQDYVIRTQSLNENSKNFVVIIGEGIQKIMLSFVKGKQCRFMLLHT